MHVSAPMPPGRAARRQGNADLWAVLPVGPGTARRRRAAEKDPQVRGGPFSAGTSVFSVIRTAAWYAPPRGPDAQRCRPPPGETLMIGSARTPRRSWKRQFPGWCKSRPDATMQSGAQARERRPLASSPGGGRHSPPKAGGGKDPEFRGGPFSAGTPAFSVIRTAAWYTPPCRRRP